MKDKEVLITGLGPLTPLGIGKESFSESLKSGESAGKRLDEVKDKKGPYPLDLEGVATKVGAPVLRFDPQDFMSKKKAKRLTRSGQFSVAASMMALKDAGLELEEREDDRYLVRGEDPKRLGVLMGTGIGGIEAFEESHRSFLNRGPGRVSPFFVPQMMPNSVGALVSISFGFKGISSVSVAACASSTQALGLASMMIKQGKVDVVLAGGTEAVLTPLILSGFSKVQATSRRNDRPEKASRPFDAERDGFLPAEGAAAVVLEEGRHAKERGARAYARVEGWGMSSDAYHVTAPDPSGEGAVISMEKAVKEAGKEPNDIDYINAHGTSTPLNDEMETRAIKEFLGERKAREVFISSNKSQFGHLMGAAGSAEAVASVLSLRDGFVPPTINYDQPDPDCDLGYTPNEAVKEDICTVLSNSFGFGGHNGTLYITKIS